MSSLFEKAGLEKDAPRPLADRLRPKKLVDVVGQDHILKDGGALHHMIAQKCLSSLIFWGPPGTGKTSISRLLAQDSNLYFEQISAVFSGVADLRKAFDAAKNRRQSGQGTLLFVDEIHRFNRSQQDSFLPYVEDGTIILVGATTENPSFELNSALLSRMQVLVLNRLDVTALGQLLSRAEEIEEKALPINSDARDMLIALSDGDGRYLLNCAEMLFTYSQDKKITSEEMLKILQRRPAQYDKDREGHYNLISALHKSLRGSDVNAALYWLARMLTAGEDPLFIIRRLVRFANEDIGLADPAAITQALAAKDTYQFLGSPEGELAIVQATIYLATAPKSNAAYVAEKSAKTLAHKTGSLNPPKHILNAPTDLMKDLGYGKGYQYDHDVQNSFSGQNFFPDEMQSSDLYQPSSFGFEKDIEKRMNYWAKLKANVGQSKVDEYE